MLNKIRNLRIRFKIALLLNTFALIIITLVSVVLAQQFKSALKERILLQLSSIRHLKTIQIEKVLNNHMHEIKTMLTHIEDSAYLDALAADQLIHIDSIVVNYEMLEEGQLPDSIRIDDISPLINDGQIHLAYHIPYDQLIYTFYSTPRAIQDILFERTGMGQTGETYIIGNDGFLRSQSRFWPDSIPTIINSQTEAFQTTTSNEQGMIQHLDYRQVEVFSAFASFQYFGLEWLILSEIDVEEALLPLQDMEHRIYLIAAIIGIAIFLISISLSWLIVKPVIKVQKALTLISKGETPTIPEYHSKDEIGVLFNTLASYIKTAEEIREFANHIADGNLNKTMVMRSENDRLVRSLNNMRSQLTEIQERERQLQIKSQRLLMAGEEKERSRLSKELHDSIGPLLTNLKLMLTQKDVDSAIIEERVQLIIEEVRKISVNLMPSVLKDFGLIAAVQSFVKQLPESDQYKVLFLSDTEEGVKLPLDLSLNAFRIIQEAVNNAMKHSKATEIKLSITEFINQVNIYIADNGLGFDINQVELGNGLVNIKERVNMFDGHLEINSDKGGTIIEVEFKTKVTA